MIRKRGGAGESADTTREQDGTIALARRTKAVNAAVSDINSAVQGCVTRATYN